MSDIEQIEQDLDALVAESEKTDEEAKAAKTRAEEAREKLDGISKRLATAIRR